MHNRWDDAAAESCGQHPLELRAYTSRLLGADASLVLHGGGNTSVKLTATNDFGEAESLLYVKGSGWDLATIAPAGFAPMRLDAVQRIVDLPACTDTDMVRLLRTAMTDPVAPNPSVEAILHAIIPHTFVDHTHADAVVAISNTPDGAARIRALYGDRMLVVPYVMPGFILAKHIAEMTCHIDWQAYDGIVLLNHGMFTFADDAKTSYTRMIDVVTQAEQYLITHGCTLPTTIAEPLEIRSSEQLMVLATMRAAVSRARGHAVLASMDVHPDVKTFASRDDVSSIATRGPITPDHIIRTKRVPMIYQGEAVCDVETFVHTYQQYFTQHATAAHRCLDPAPRWAIWPTQGTLAFGCTLAEVEIIRDIARHTMSAITWGEQLATWQPLSEAELFAMEYWVLEQAKLGGQQHRPPLQGKIALVTGAMHGIGHATVEALRAAGAVVAAVDIDPAITTATAAGRLGIRCDVTDTMQLADAVRDTVSAFGGLDLVVSNAGMFPESYTIAALPVDVWQQSLALNLSSHQQVMQQCIPFLVHGIDPSIIVIASKNVAAPGPGAAAYSVAKAGLTQLARVAALELAPAGVRVNVIHPNQVFDTALWTTEKLTARATHYGMSIAEYTMNNALGVEVVAADVAAMVCTMAGPVFTKTTGAQVPVDGGNARVI